MITEKTDITVLRHPLAGDLYTAVNLFLSLRDHYPDAVLLESNNFKSLEDCHSFIGLESIATFEVKKGMISWQLPSDEAQFFPVKENMQVANSLYDFLQACRPKDDNGFNGLFGHTNFDSIQYFETIELDDSQRWCDIPDMRYNFYRYLISFNHFNDKIEIIENIPFGEESRIDELMRLIKAGKYQTHQFVAVGGESSNITDEEYKKLVSLGKHHCQIGDVFQIVFSRQFRQSFQGDDFNVYRSLRSINPSPYLFYFDYGDYKILGSSPETQMQIKGNIARVNPIAGTYKRSGNDVIDAERTADLKADPKENAEHIMLVDLARNDLGRHCKNVEVLELKEIHYFSHVIHLVSRVEGLLPKTANPITVFGDTFPAGTLSGAPKYKAMQLINQYENQNRGIYGGALGFIDFDGNMNQAIVIRSFLSMNNQLYYQAGGGIVVSSEEEKELQEVNNKLGALKKAIIEAEGF